MQYSAVLYSAVQCCTVQCSVITSRVQMEDWTTAEAGLFEEAMEKYGKGFNDIWTDFLPWKTVRRSWTLK